MAPVIQDQKPPSASSDRPSGSGQKRPSEKQKELVMRVKYQNTLPDIPFDPKFLVYPFDSNRFVEYKPTSLEKNYKYDLLTEHDLGITIDLINNDAYNDPAGPLSHLHPEDERLLEEETQTNQDSKRSKHHNKIVPWLKKTEYISTEFNRYGASSEKTETKVGYNVRKQIKEETLYMDRESQIEAINKTFEDAKLPITKHHSKNGVTPVEIMPVFPDFELWKYPFAQVQFDADPAPETQVEEMSQALIRGVMDESGDQFVAYFLPTQETLEKRRRDQAVNVPYMEGETYEYKMAREYNWVVKSRASKGFEEAYFFVQREGCFFYNELETRVRLTKRRKTGPAPANSWVIVRHRDINEPELRTQNMRNRKIQPPMEEDEEEEEEQAEGEGEAQQDQEEDGVKREEGDEGRRANDENDEAEDVKPKIKKEKDKSESSSSDSSSSSSSSESSDEGESSSASSSFDSDSESETKKKKVAEKKSTAQEIFGDSDSD